MSWNVVLRISLLIVIVAAVTFLVLRYPGKATVKVPDGSCDAKLWDHVYERARLQILQACTAVEGRVVSVHRSQDGDLHIALNPDNKSVLNLVNAVHAHRTLIVEAVCDHEPSTAIERAACGDFHSQVAMPKAGQRIRVIGAYVKDRDNGWNEIHPVSRIEMLP